MQFDRIKCFDKLEVKIPSHWVDEYEDDAGSYKFFDPEGGSGVLRVSVISITRIEDLDFESLKQKHFQREEASECFTLDEEIAVVEWNDPSQNEPGLQMFYWDLAANVTTKLTRRAVFSYAVNQSKLESNAFKAEFEVIAECVLETEFLQEAQ